VCSYEAVSVCTLQTLPALPGNRSCGQNGSRRTYVSDRSAAQTKSRYPQTGTGKEILLPVGPTASKIYKTPVRFFSTATCTTPPVPSAPLLGQISLPICSTTNESSRNGSRYACSNACLSIPHLK